LGCELWGTLGEDEIYSRMLEGFGQKESAAFECGKAFELVKGWAERYANDGIVEIVAKELEFDLPIVNQNSGRKSNLYRQRGKIDAIGKLPDGRLCVIERKTVGEALDVDSKYWLKLQLDSQISRYMLAAMEMGYPVETIVYDVVRKPLIRITQKENLQQYLMRLRADLRERPDFYFARKEVVRLDSDLKEFQAEDVLHARMLRDSVLYEREHGQSAWPRNTGACVMPYPCPYLDSCRVGFDVNALPPNFVKLTDLFPELTNGKEDGNE
jgi:hypothetical protein